MSASRSGSLPSACSSRNPRGKWMAPGRRPARTSSVSRTSTTTGRRPPSISFRTDSGATSGTSPRSLRMASSLYPTSTSSGDGGDHADLVARLHLGLRAPEPPHVLSVDEDVDEAADLPAGIEHFFLDASVPDIEVLKEAADGGACALDFRQSLR